MEIIELAKNYITGSSIRTRTLIEGAGFDAFLVMFILVVAMVFIFLFQWRMNKFSKIIIFAVIGIFGYIGIKSLGLI